MTAVASTARWARWLVAAAALGLGLVSTQALAQAPAAAAAPQRVSHGLFSDVQLFRPVGTLRQFVLLLSADVQPSMADQRLIETMRKAGAMVALVPLAPFYKRLEAQDGQCTYAGGAFENLSRHIQASEKLPTYLLPMVVGSGRAASFAYALLAQAPAGTFASAISLDFCPRLMFRTPPCAANALRTKTAADGGVDLLPAAQLPAPWSAVPTGAVAACTPTDTRAFAPAPTSTTFEATYAALAAQEKGLDPPPAQLADLPVVEVPPTSAGPRFAVLISGDGGWAAIDKGIAASLQKQGVPVVGFDSLRYFWSARTPEGLAADLDRLIRYYADRWKRSEVILIGYSQGADVMPFALNRLPARTRARVKLTALLGLGQKAAFEFHVSNWIGPSGDKPIAPEARKLLAADTLCIYGQDEKDSLCPQLAPAHVRALPLAGGHHFGGDYDVLAARILEAVPK